MFIALYFLIANFVFPKVQAFATAMFEPVIITLIVLAGIVMLLGSVGMKVSTNLGATIVVVLANAIGYIVRTFIQAIRWAFRTTARLTPRVFYVSRNFFTARGLNPQLSNILAVMVSMLFVAVIV